MATYVVTRSPRISWDERFTYKYRLRSRDGHALAQDEIERRRRRGEPAVLWRWESGKSILVERHRA